MAVPAHGLSTWLGIFGTVGAPIEQWQFSVKSAAGPSLDDSAMDILADSLKSCWTTNLAPLFTNEVILTEVKHVQIGADGLYKTRGDGSYVQGHYAGNHPGAATLTSRQPLQTAVAVSLNTTRSGPTGKGRFFLPQTSHPVGTDYRLSEASRDSIATAVAEFVRDVNAAVGPVGVASSKGYITPVTAVRVGRAFDTMRSRREKVLEALEPVAL